MDEISKIKVIVGSSDYFICKCIFFFINLLIIAVSTTLIVTTYLMSYTCLNINSADYGLTELNCFNDLPTSTQMIVYSLPISFFYFIKSYFALDFILTKSLFRLQIHFYISVFEILPQIAFIIIAITKDNYGHLIIVVFIFIFNLIYTCVVYRISKILRKEIAKRIQTFDRMRDEFLERYTETSI